MKESINKIILLISIIILFSLSGCALLDTNDVDIQLSSSIADSKQKCVFICKYEIMKCPKEFHINEAWQEKLWSNKIDNPFRRSIQIDSTDSNVYLQLNSSNDSIFDMRNIFEKWELVNDSTQEIASSIQGRLGIYQNKNFKVAPLISLTLILNPHSEKRDTIGTVILKALPAQQPL